MILKNSNKNWLIQQSDNQPDLIALYNGIESLTYSEVLIRAAKRAGSLSALGIASGMNVALFGNNTIEYIINIFSLWLLNAVPVPLNTRLTEKELEYLIIHSDSQFVIYDEQYNKSFSNVKCFSFDNIEQMDKENTIVPSGYFGRTAAIIYTSGSEGAVKGVPISFNNLFNSTASIDEIVHFTNKDKFLVSLPLYHIGGFSICIRSLLSGGCSILPGLISSDNIIKYILNSMPTIISLVPTMLKSLVDEEIKPPASLRTVFIGGGPSDKSVIIQAVKLGYPIAKVYGSTETCAMVTYLSTDEALKKPGSSGKPLPNTSIKIAGENGKINPPNTRGEIIVESNSLFDGYFNNSVLTAKVLKDGIYYTGDTGFLDNDGFLFVESRRKDLIVTGGENVVPSEVEDIIRSHEEVKDAFVFGIDNDKWGQEICAAVVSDKNIKQSLTDFLNDNLPKYKQPKKIIYLNNLPYNEMSKVNVSKLIELIKLNESSNNS